MEFLDEVRIRVTSGAGGDGCSSFRREKYVPFGGPDGGDGGRGGNVVLCATRDRNTLLHLRTRPLYAAPRGEHGRGRQRNGKGGEDLVLEVPVGTRVMDEDTGHLLADLTEDGETWIAAEGGRGGLGNIHFKTSTNRAPRNKTPGGPAIERTLGLELMLMADVGLVGFPNAGKSTLISTVSAAKPRVANYPFTTLAPSLGVVRLDEDTTFVMADIPGLIQGASDGAGLGHQFLRHVQRTRVLLHLVSLSPFEAEAPRARYDAIRAELGQYDELLAESGEALPDPLANKPEVILLTQCDLVDEEVVTEAAQAMADIAHPVLVVSASARIGIPALMAEIRSQLHKVTGETEGTGQITDQEDEPLD